MKISLGRYILFFTFYLRNAQGWLVQPTTFFNYKISNKRIRVSLIAIPLFQMLIIKKENQDEN